MGSQAEGVTISFDLGIAALVGEKLYNFGELLEHPVVSVLEQTEFAWLAHLLRAFNAGDIDQYESLFQRIGPTADRTVEFATIAAASKLPIDQVELLLMRALSLGLIKGVIDQVEQTVRVSWVQPRVLQTAQIALMTERLKSWCGTVNTTLTMLDSLTPEFAA